MLISKTTAGGLITNPIMKRILYVGYQYQAWGGAQNPTASLGWTNFGPNKTLYVCVITTRGSGGANYTAPTFNNRTMTQIATAGVGPTKPVIWYSIKLLDTENSGTFKWNESSAAVQTMGVWAWVTRGMRSTTPYSSGGGTAAGSSTGSFINQVNSLTLNHPAYEKSFAIMTVAKGLNDGDGTYFTGYTNFGNGAMTQQTHYYSTNNTFIQFQGYNVHTNTSATDTAIAYSASFQSNSLPISMYAGIVLY